MNNDFIQELKEKRERYGVSQSRLAVACGISREYYNRIENGRTQLTEALKVSGLQKDYDGKITLLNRLADKYPNSPYAVSALYEKGRSYVQGRNNSQAIATFRELLNKYPESPVSRKAAAEIGRLLGSPKRILNQGGEVFMITCLTFKRKLYICNR